MFCDNNLSPDVPPGSPTWGFLHRDIIARAKRARLAGWIEQQLPTILDVSPGYDGHIVWGKGTGPNPLVGDNSYGYDDPWRNYLSAFKGVGNVGITMTSWNGFTEGMAVMPGRRKTEPGVEDGKKPEDYPIEHYEALGIPEHERERTRYDWVRTLYASDPRSCDFWQFVNGAPTHHVYRAICKHWQDLGAQLGLEATPWITFGDPTTSEDWSSAHNRVTRFGIPGYPDFFGFYWKPDIGAHEVHGSIYAKYKLMGEDASYLGVPTTDELSNEKWCPNCRFNVFKNGWIDWCPPAPGRGELVWAHTGPDEGYPGH